MRYIRVCYMCPECNRGFMFDKASHFSTLCPHCNIEMVCVEEKATSTEIEEREERRKKYTPSAPLIHCPYCHSMNTKKISNIAKAGSAAMFGIFSQKVKHQWHCNNCGSDF